jgi:hypothetical protein
MAEMNTQAPEQDAPATLVNRSATAGLPEQEEERKSW